MNHIEFPQEHCGFIQARFSKSSSIKQRLNKNTPSINHKKPCLIAPPHCEKNSNELNKNPLLGIQENNNS